MGIPKVSTQEVSYLLKVTLLIIVFLPVLIYFFKYKGVIEENKFYEDLGKESATPLIYAIVGYCCAEVCVRWAHKIKKSVNWAYSIGFLFGLFGLLGYWLYYKNMRKTVGYTIVIIIILTLLSILITFSVFYFIGTKSTNQSEQIFEKSPTSPILQKPKKPYADYQLENDMSNNPPKWFKDECFQFCFNKISEGEWVEQSYSYDLYKEKYECACRKGFYGNGTLLGNFSYEFKKENWFKWECYNKTSRMEYEVCLCSKEEYQQTHDACLYETAKKWNQKEICNTIIREWVKNNCFDLLKS